MNNSCISFIPTVPLHGHLVLRLFATVDCRRHLMANTLSSTRPKREIKKRVVIDFNDFIKSGNEDRELARAIRESLKSTAAAPAPPDTKSDSKSDARAGIGDKAGKAKGTTTTTASTRPKRIMNTVKKAMFDYSDLQVFQSIPLLGNDILFPGSSLF